MPLHRQNEVVTGDFDGLDHPVGVLCADHQAVAEPVDGLVVVALRVGRLADQRRPAGCPGTVRTDEVREHRVALLMAGVPDDVGQMLVQRAAQRHVEHLRAAADARAPAGRAASRRESARTPTRRGPDWPARARRWPDEAAGRRWPGRCRVPPVMISPSSPSSTRSASASTGCGGSSTAMPPARLTPSM